MLIKQVDHNGTGENIRFGDTFTEDQFSGEKFDYLIANPPFGVDWKKQERVIEDEHNKLGFAGRFGAGSGESDIRKWIIENDWLEAIVALPEQMFYNTGIGTYVWIVTNRKDKRRKIGEGKDGEPDQIADIVRLFGTFADGDQSKIFDNEDFGYTRVTVERPLRLRYQMDTERKARFLDACPELLDDVQEIDKQRGRKSLPDWNEAWKRIADVLDERGTKSSACSTR